MSLKLKKSISLLLSMCMVLSLFSGVVFTNAAAGWYALSWTDIVGDGYEISNVQNKTQGYAIVNGSDNANEGFRRNDNITCVIAPEAGYTITAIYIQQRYNSANLTFPSIRMGDYGYGFDLENLNNNSQLIVTAVPVTGDGTPVSALYAVTYTDTAISAVIDATSGVAVVSGDVSLAAGQIIKFSLASGVLPVVSRTDDSSITVPVSQSADGGYYFVMPEYSVTISTTPVPTDAYTVTWTDAADDGYTVGTVTDVTASQALTSATTPVAAGNEVVISVSADAGYTLTGVTVASAADAAVTVQATVGADGNYYFTMPAYNVTVTINAAQNDADGTVSWTDAADDGYTVGTVTDVTVSQALISATTPVAAGNEVAISVSADAGYTLTGVTVASAADAAVTVQATVGADGNYYFTMPAYNVTVTINVVQNDADGTVSWTNADDDGYTITAVTDVTASQALISATTPVAAGHEVAISVSADAGYTLTGVTVASAADAAITVQATAGADGNYYFTMPDYDVVLSAEAQQVVFDTPTTTALTYYDFTPGGLFAGDVVYLTAKVSETTGGAAVNSGYVTFYYLVGNAASPAEIPFANVQLAGGAAYATVTLPEGVVGFKAVFSGVRDLYAASSDTRIVSVESKEIKWTGSNTLSSGTVFAVNTDYTLTVPAVESTTGTALTAGKDYLVTWQMYKDGVWVNMEENTALTSYAVKANETGIKYRVVVMPAGNYTLPASGLVSAEISVTEKADLAGTVLSVTSPSGMVFYEGELITLELTSTDVPAPTGTVWFTMPDGTKRAVEFDHGTALIQWKVPSELVNTGAEILNAVFSATYSGNGIYNAKTLSINNYELRTKTLSGKNAVITADIRGTEVVESESVLTTYTTYDLTLSGVKDAQGRILTEGTDYTVSWYVSVGNGTYIQLSDASGLKPLSTKYSYKAVVTPAGDYKDGGFEVLIGCDNPVSTAITISHTDATASGTYEGQTLTLNAFVFYRGGEFAIGGTVTFYAVNGLNYVAIGTAPLVNGNAQLQYNGLPVGASQISAYYSGVEGVYNPSNISGYEVEILSASLSNNAWALNTYSVEVGTSMALELVASSTAASYTYGEDYYVVWQVSKDSGLTWTDTAKLESIKAAPMDSAWQYRALVYPMGNYIKTDDGAYIIVGNVTATKAVTTTEITVVNEAGGDIFEGHDRILLTANVDSANLDVTVGVVSFYYSTEEYANIADITANATKLGDVDVNTLGNAFLNIPAPAAGTYYYYAVYNTGINGSFEESFASAVKTVYSTTIRFADAVPMITIDPSAITVGGDYTLTAPNVVSYEGRSLTVDEDYYYIWYYSPDGSNWYMVPAVGPSNICIGTFDSVDAIYRAVAYPMGDYRLPENGIAVSVSGAQAIQTVTTLSISGEFQMVSGMYYFPSGTQITLTAQVVDAGGSPASGVVRFYRDGVEIGSAQYLDAAGKASVSFKAESSDTDLTGTYYAVFTGNDVYQTSASSDAADNITIVPNTIALVGEITGAPSDGMTVGNSYTLIAPDVVISGSSSTDVLTKFDMDIAYYYKWQVSYDDGVSWTDLAQTGKSITVTPENIHYAYRVIALPVSTTGFINPYTGDVSDKVITSKKAASNVEIEVQGLTANAAYEGMLVTLTAKVPEVKLYNLDNQGSVTFYYSLDGGATLTLIPYPATFDVDAAGEATAAFVMPTYDTNTDNGIVFYVYYSGSEHFAPSEDDTSDIDVRIRSTAIAWGEDSGVIVNGITIYEGAGTSGDVVTDGIMKAGNIYTLALPEVYAEDDLNTPLVPGLDYNVQWYYSIDDGASWNLADWVSDDQTTLTVENEQVDWSYRAYIYPYSVDNHTVLSHYNKVVAYPKQNPVTYANYLTAEIEARTQRSNTQTVLSVSEYFALEEDSAIALATDGKHMTEFEGDKVRLTATVVEAETGNKNPVTTGYVVFYQNGLEIGRVELNTTNVGIVSLEADMSAYGDMLPAANNKDVFTATYFENEYYTASSSNEETVYIRSTTIDTPIISATYGVPSVVEYTTKTDSITGLPAGIAIKFTLINNVTGYASVVATDGRTVSAEDYTIRWQKLSGAANFTDAILAAGSMFTDTYEIVFGNMGDTYRVYLEPKNNMDVGAASQNAVIGDKLTPVIVLTPEFTYDPSLDITYTGVNAVKGSHFGDNVALTAIVKGTVTAPTGWVEFFYTTDSNPTVKVSLGSVELKPNGVGNESTAVLETTILPVDLLQLSASYKGYDADSDGSFEGDSIYTVAESGVTVYKVWSVNISDTEFTEVKNTETGYGLVIISATDSEGNPVTSGASLTANNTYTLTLEDIYTKSGEKLNVGEYKIQWFTSTDYVPGTAVDVNDAAAKWTYLSMLDDMTAVTVTPESQNTMYIVLVTTTDSLYNKDYPSTSLADSEYSNIIGAALQNVSVIVTTSSAYVYQANDLTIFAEVKPEIAGNVSGYVEFYYTFENASGDYSASTWYPVVSKESDAGNTAALIVKSGATGVDATMIAQITSNTLYVEADGTASRLVFKAVYLGNETYQAAVNIIEGEGDKIAVDSPVVDVYSSIVYVDAATENKYITRETGAKGIVIEPASALVSDGTVTYLTLNPVFTLDAYDAAGEMGIMETPPEFSKLSVGADYTILWQQRPIDAAQQDTWETIASSSDAMQSNIIPQEGYAYRVAIVTLASSEKVKAANLGWNDIVHGIEGIDDAWITNGVATGVYYSNIITVSAGNAILGLNPVPASSVALDGDEVTFEIFVTGGETTPNGKVTLTVTNEDGNVVFTDDANLASGMVNIPWTEADGTTMVKVPAGEYTITVSAVLNNGYVADPIVETYIVRYTDHTMMGTNQLEIYDADRQFYDIDRITFTFDNFYGIDESDLEALAASMVVISYYNEAGEKVEAPLDAGIYTVKAYLPESIYWTEIEETAIATLTVEKRALSVVDIIAQHKVYDGSTNADILVVTLEDAATDQAETGLPTGKTGLIDGDSVYATGVARTSTANAGACTITFNTTSLIGPDAHNYKLPATYTEDFEIYRNQLEGEFQSGVVIPFDSFDMIDITEYFTVIEESGAQFDAYTLTWYYHDAGSVIKVEDPSALLVSEQLVDNDTYVFTVVLKPVDTVNYKGGVSGTITVDRNAKVATAPKLSSFESTILHISNTYEIYGDTENTGVAVALTNTEATAEIQYYIDGTWTQDVPTDAGRYAVLVTASTGDTEVGIYTVIKAEGVYKIPYVEDKIFDGEPVTYTASGDGMDWPAGTYATWSGGRIQGISYEAPSDAGTYLVTVHIPETENYVAATVSYVFTIAKRTANITICDIYNNLFATNPKMYVNYELASGGITGLVNGDSSLRDVLIDPTLLLTRINDTATGDSMNDVGEYNIDAVGASAYNYVFTYSQGALTMNATNPQEALTILGAPDGVIRYGDEFTLFGYGNKGSLIGGGGINMNNSSEISWQIIDGTDVAVIDADGNVTIIGVGSFTVRYTRGTGAYMIYVDQTYTAEKKEITMLIADDDFVYDTMDHVISDTNFSFTGLVGSDTLTVTGDSITQNPTSVCNDLSRDDWGAGYTDVGEYVVHGEFETDLYYGSGAGLLTIHRKEAEIAPDTDATGLDGEMVYGENPEVSLKLGYVEFDVIHPDILLNGGIAITAVDSNDDVGEYEILVGSGKTDNNYNIAFISEGYHTENDIDVVIVVANDNLTIESGWSPYTSGEGDADLIAKTPVERMYGEPMPNANTDIDGLISGDSAADLNLTDGYVLTKDVSGNVYVVPVKANKVFNNSASMPGAGSAPAYASAADKYILDIADVVNINNNYKNYIANSKGDAALVSELIYNVFQRPVTLKAVDSTNRNLEVVHSTGWSTVYEQLLNLLYAEKWEGIGGLAEAYGETIVDLGVYFEIYDTNNDLVATVYADHIVGNADFLKPNAMTTYRVIPKISNTNYKLMEADTLSLTVTLTKVLAIVTPGKNNGITSFTVTTYLCNYNPETDTWTQKKAFLSSPLEYKIFARTSDGDYSGETSVRNGVMSKTSSEGVYTCTYSKLDKGGYEIFLSAKGYNIVRTM